MAIGQSSQKERPFLVFCFDEKMEEREDGGMGVRDLKREVLGEGTKNLQYNF